MSQMPLPHISPYTMPCLGMDFGGLHSVPAIVPVDFLMPNSIIIQHNVDTTAPLGEIKEVGDFTLSWTETVERKCKLRLDAELNDVTCICIVDE